MVLTPYPLAGFRSNPERLQQMLRMASMFREAGGSPFGNPFGGGLGGGFGGTGAGASGFPAPGVPGGATTTPPVTSPNSGTTPGSGPSPFNMFGGAGAGPGAGTSAGGVPPNPFGMDPAMMQQLMGMGPLGLGGGGGGFGGMPAAPATPADTRPPEERFQVQLQVSKRDYASGFTI